MYSSAFPPLPVFELTGTLKSWLQEPGQRAKGFWLQTSQGEYRVKLTKTAWQLLQKFPGLPSVGTPLRVWGKCKQKDGKLKLKAEQLQLLPVDYLAGSTPAFSPVPKASVKQIKLAPAKILVCQKSDCCRRGGTAVKKAMLAHLEEWGLADQVEVKSTGCLGGCSKGPNVVMMPGKTRINHLTPADVPQVLAKHFPAVMSPVAPAKPPLQAVKVAITAVG